MTERILLLAIHNHQPVGNFAHVFDQAFRLCYEPLLKELGRHPRFKFSLHFSGPLWDYMEKKERTSFGLVGEMVARGQAELLGGGFYEPILSVIPEEDRVGQVLLLRSHLEKTFGVKARGLWLAERVWEPNLPRCLTRAGVEYTLLDEEHFHYAGVDDIHASYLTEDEGRPLRVFPIDKKLRYLIPFHPVEEVRSYLDEIAERGGLAILGDDGEKFGLWPGTNKHVYEDRWLDAFLDMVDREGITTLTLAEAFDRFPPRGRVYIPPASYEEMMEWVLEPEAQREFKDLKRGLTGPQRRFLRGGFFREFFRKYPESNNLHKRMLLASREVRRHPNEAARKHVYMAQGNDPYWHGVFGGLYLPHLRQAAYHHIIEAEKRMPLAKGWASLDFDADGREEVILRGKAHSVFVKPACGGALVCLDSLRLGRNLLDVLSRRREAYHLQTQEGSAEGKSIHELAKVLPSGSEALLCPDPNLRYSALDRFYAPDTTADDLVSGRSVDRGDFVGAEYRFRLDKGARGGRKRQPVTELCLSRQGSVVLENTARPLAVTKRIVPKSDGFGLVFTLENPGPADLSFIFASEWNFCAFPGEWELDREAALFFGRSVRLDCPRAEGLWLYPLQTLSQSEKGYDIIHQGICLTAAWRLALSAGASCSVEVILTEKHGS